MSKAEEFQKLNELIEKSLEPLRVKMGANNVVLGHGSINSKVMLIGEAPGENEDIENMPFVGRAGDLLDKLLIEGKLSRKQCYLTNLVKCRPIGEPRGKYINRPPSKEEIAICKPYLWKEMKLLNPAVIVTLGKVPTQLLLDGHNENFKKKKPMDELVGTAFDVPYLRAKIVPAWNPSFLLRGKAYYINKTVSAFRLASIWTHT